MLRVLMVTTSLSRSPTCDQACRSATECLTHRLPVGVSVVMLFVVGFSSIRRTLALLMHLKASACPRMSNRPWRYSKALAILSFVWSPEANAKTLNELPVPLEFGWAKGEAPKGSGMITCGQCEVEDLSGNAMAEHAKSASNVITVPSPKAGTCGFG